MVDSDDIVFSEDSEDIGRQLVSKLLVSLRTSLPQAENTSFVFTARDSSSELIGGLTASTSYGWLLVKILWVDDDYRKRGIGRALMTRAHEKAIEVGCHGIWLETSNPNAMEFYRRLGYETFGELRNAQGQQPESHRRWFMKKMLWSGSEPGRKSVRSGSELDRL